jgi:hypothetical protein
VLGGPRTNSKRTHGVGERGGKGEEEEERKRERTKSQAREERAKKLLPLSLFIKQGQASRLRFISLYLRLSLARIHPPHTAWGFERAAGSSKEKGGDHLKAKKS